MGGSPISLARTRGGNTGGPPVPRQKFTSSERTSEGSCLDVAARSFGSTLRMTARTRAAHKSPHCAAKLKKLDEQSAVVGSNQLARQLMQSRAWIGLILLRRHRCWWWRFDWRFNGSDG